jgi:hypothetical protein
MAIVLTLIEDPTGTPVNHIQAKGLVTRIEIGERALAEKITKFWGVDGESRIAGGYGGRDIQVEMTIYDDAEEDEDFDTARKLADYLDVTLNTTKKGESGQLTITSESNHAPFDDCRFGGCALLEGPKLDVAGMLGGGYWADVVLMFRQLS